MSNELFPQPRLKTFEGRVLDRQDEDVEDQGLAFDMKTIESRLSRRKLLGFLGIGAGSAALAACAPGGQSDGRGSSSTATSGAPSTTGSTSAADLTETKTETAGPYPGDGSNGPDVLEKVGVERRDIRGSIGGGATASGVSMTLKMNIIDMVNSNAPMAGAAVYIWHCDSAGGYSMYSSGLEDETYLRGVQVTGEDGSVEFTTIVPGCYEGRYPHIHFEVFPSVDDISVASNAILTSQIAIPAEVCDPVYETDNYEQSRTPYSRISLDSDNVFHDGWDEQLPSFTGSVEGGYDMELNVAIDTTTPNSGGNAAPNSGGGPGESAGPGGPGGQPLQGMPEPPNGERPSGPPPFSQG
ncbi:dioxygenase family protein [Corynebacterium urinipleomorphum]|uniref:dioxygenase family protein n=1 Tax=Corynebacterium urinipleomorphum TaxID=1852380 RepID=UPI000B364301|nr:3,4-dioxygenase subunit beta [Corynebacterium urinipleomorphum]